MEHRHERSTLSERERALLAELEASITASDPELSRQLNSDGTGTAATSTASKPWPAAVALVVGTAMMLTFTINLWVAVAGVALMAAGLAHLLTHWAPAAFAGARGRARQGPDPGAE